MKVAVRGDVKDRRLKQLLKQGGYDVLYEIDRNSSLWGHENEGIICVSQMKAQQLYVDGKIDRIYLNPNLGINSLHNIVAEMEAMDIKKCDIYIPTVRAVKELETSELDQPYDFNRLKQLYYLEYHIADNCNLNCEGCSHFSSLTNKSKHPQLGEIEKDFKRLKEIVNHIEWIRILGGEPFLNKNWKEYILITKQYWKYTKISIVTNGLLLRTIKECDLEFIKQQGIELDISPYRPIWGMIDDIVIRLRKMNVKYQIMSDPITEFTSCFDLNSTDDYVQKRQKCNAPCNNLYHGRITPCPQMMYIDIFNKKYGTNLPEDCFINIYEKDMDFIKLEEKLKEPKELCRFCNMGTTHRWKNITSGEANINGWLV